MTNPMSDGHDELIAAPRSGLARMASASTVGRPAKKHLFLTRSPPSLFDAFLEALPEHKRAEYTCKQCRTFVIRYGGLVALSEDGQACSVFWNPETAPDLFRPAFRALALRVEHAPIDTVFLSDKGEWGAPGTPPFTHFSVQPPSAVLSKRSLVKDFGEQMAEKKHELETLLAGLEAFPIALVKKAHALLKTESLYRAEHGVAIARWLLDLHQQRAAVKSARAMDNVTWLAVAGAPPGFCHVRTSLRHEGGMRWSFHGASEGRVSPVPSHARGLLERDAYRRQRGGRRLRNGTPEWGVRSTTPPRDRPRRRAHPLPPGQVGLTSSPGTKVHVRHGWSRRREVRASCASCVQVGEGSLRYCAKFAVHIASGKHGVRLENLCVGKVDAQYFCDHEQGDAIIVSIDGCRPSRRAMP